jgi:hypothetical protein
VADARLAANVARVNQVWLLGGNAGTTPSTQFLGTTDNQPLEFRVNGRRALRLEDNGDSIEDGNILSDGAPNVIGGSPGNFVLPGVVGATIGGGGATNIGGVSWTNAVRANFGTVGGGFGNVVAADSSSSTIAGGFRNNIGTNSSASAIGGGNLNTIGPISPLATIAGGIDNSIGTNSGRSTIGGGWANNIAARYITIAGGAQNSVGTNSDYSAIGGGDNNNVGANSARSVIGGGENNDIAANAVAATIPGGSNNEANGYYSFAAGRRAKALFQGAFVWADSQFADFSSPFPDSVSFRCQNGVRFTSGDAGGNQTVSWLPGFAAWSFSSDRNLKEGLTAVNTREVLDKVSRLPMNEWNFKGYPQRHIGPMAQDFHAQFPLNDNERMIDSGDLHGVALAAIQGLNQKVEEREAALRKELKRRDAENAELKTRLTVLEELIANLSKKGN